MSEQTGPRLFRAQQLDLVEKYVMAAVFALFAHRMIQAYMVTGSPVTLIYLADQCVILAFILFRRPPKELSVRFGDWFVGVAGTFLAILIGPPSDTALVPTLVYTALLLLGFAIHFSAKLSLRRSFGVVAANRGIKASGPYRLVRHPMYLGYVLSQAGLLLAGPTLINAILIGMCWALFIMRIVAEERLLMQDEAYQAFASRTRFRLVPGVY